MVVGRTVVGTGGGDAPSAGLSEILQGGIFLPGGENLRRSDFGNSHLFSKLKTVLCEY